MKRHKIDPNMPIGKMTRVKDFLPPPEKLVFPHRKTVKVTISLSEVSVQFFKQQAKKHHVKYQQMIRELLDSYAIKYSESH